MSTNFFDEDELKNLPPIERAKLIQKKKAELERKLEEEASSLEEASKVELINQQKELDVIIESESLQRKSAEEEDLKRQQSMLEQTINNSPESESKSLHSCEKSIMPVSSTVPHALQLTSPLLRFQNNLIN